MRDYTPLALLETTFILTDGRYRALAKAAKVGYIAIWCRAFLERREILPLWYDCKSFALDAALDLRTARKVATSLQHACLITVLVDGRVRVNGVSEKGKIAWKDLMEVGQLKLHSMGRESREKKKRDSERGPAARPASTGGAAGRYAWHKVDGDPKTIGDILRDGF